MACPLTGEPPPAHSLSLTSRSLEAHHVPAVTECFLFISLAIVQAKDIFGVPAYLSLRSRSQTLGSESSLDEGLKPASPASPQQIFSGLVGVPSAAVSSAQLQVAGLVLGSPPEVFIQMTASSREEGGPRRTEAGPFLPRPPPLHHLHHFHHQPLQHRTSSLLQQAALERPGSREEAPEDPSTPAPALSELKAVVTWLQRGFPFILILLAKVCFQHKLGRAGLLPELQRPPLTVFLSCRHRCVCGHGQHLRLRQRHLQAPGGTAGNKNSNCCTDTGSKDKSNISDLFKCQLNTRRTQRQVRGQHDLSERRRGRFICLSQCSSTLRIS